MKSHMLFKPYLYTVSTAGIALALWQLATVPMDLSLQLLMFILFGMVAECFDHYYEDRHVSLTLGAANSFFMMMFFPFSAVALSGILSMLALAYMRKRKGLLKSILNEKTIYNIATCTIFNYATYLGIKALEIDLSKDILLVVLMVLFQNILNGIMMCTVQSLAANKSNFDKLFKNELMYYLYTLLFSLMLVYNYRYIGFWAVMGIYSIFLTVQGSMQLEVDNRIKGEKIYKDNLTGVYNKEYFIRTIEEKLKNRRKFSIIMLDMDGFKEINDKYGHLAGDKSLQEFVNKIRKMLRKEDLLYRYGGDEFAIIVADGDAAAVVERKLYMGRFMIHLKDSTVDIRFSTGIYNCTGSEVSYEAIFEKVDAAMYEAKQKGGHQSAYAAVDECKLS